MRSSTLGAVVVVLTFAPAEAQEQVSERAQLFVAPIAEFDVEFGGPTRYDYLEHLTDAPECSGIVPVSKEDMADFVVWFEFRKHFREYHYMTLWSASGHRVAASKNRGSSNIVTAVCNAIAAQAIE